MGKRENLHMPSNLRLRRTRVVRVVALAVAMFYLFQQIAWAQGGAAVSSSAISTPVAEVKDLYRENLPNIPYEFGETREFSVDTSADEVVFHIQDSHASLDAQYSIVELLDTLATDYDVSLIALEGAEGYIDTSVLQSFPDKEIREDTAERLMKEGLMGAAEFFTVTRDEKNIDLYGIEDEELYRKNVNEFRETIEKRAGVIANTDKFLAQLNLLEKEICSEELRRLNHNSFLHSECEMSFSDYRQELREFTNRFKIDTGKFRELTKLLEAIKLEKKIDFPKANTERRALIDKLSELLDKTVLKELVMKSVDFQKKSLSPSEFHKYLVRLAEKHKIPSKNYPNLNTFTRYISVYEGINLFSLATETESLETEIRENLYRNEDERRLVEITKMTSYLRRLYSMELTPRDYAFIKTRRNAYNAEEFSAFIKNTCHKYGVTLESGYDLREMFAGMEQAAEFYETAEDRNRHMLRNTVTRMKAGGKRVAALVTGGYHTDGLTKIMKEKKLSYLVIAPKFESGEERPYIAVLTGKKKPYQKLLESEKYQLAMEPFFYRSNMEKLKEKLFYALGRAVLKGDDPDEVKDIWFNAHKKKYETIFSEKENKTKFGAITPIELKAFFDNIHIIRSGNRAIIGDKTEKNSIVVLANKNNIYDFKAATPEQKRKFLRRISEGKMPFPVIPAPAGGGSAFGGKAGIYEEEIDITDFVQEREKILTKLDGYIGEIAKEILTNLTEKTMGEDDIKKEAVTLLKRKGMPSNWENDIGFKKRVNKVIALVRQELSMKEEKVPGEWKKAVDVKNYWNTLKNILKKVPEELPVGETSFEFPDFVNQAWNFIQQIIDSEEFNREIMQYYVRKGTGGNKDHQDIIQRLESLRAEMLSNQTFNMLSDDVPEEIRNHWNYVVSKYDGCRWFGGITEKHTKIFEEILREKITPQNKLEIEKYITCFKESISSKNEKQVPWCVPANYIFIKILEASKYWENGVDVYKESKEQSCDGGVESFINNIDVENLEKIYEKQDELDIRATAKEMLEILLLGNMYSDPTHKTKEKKHEKYLVDDSEETLDYLFKLREQTRQGKNTELHVLHDNVGLELVSVFHFVDFCIKNQIIKKVVLHTKNYPYCVSDVTGEKDIRMQINALKNASELSGIAPEKSENIKHMEQLSNDITEHLKSQNIVIATPQWFPAVGQNFVDIPENYYAELEKADIIMAIGDFWYRKLFLHRNWEYTANAKEILSYMPAPTLVIRIGKSPMLAGLTAKMARYLKKTGKWWKPPRFGMIHFARGGKYARKETDYKEYEVHEETIDEQLEIAYTEGRFRPVEEKIIAPVAKFFGELGYKKISHELAMNPEKGKRQITINEITGIKNFRGHASWRGVHVDAELGAEEKQKVLVHEIGAYYRLTHGLNLDLEALYADYLKENEVDKKTDRKKFSKLKEMNALPEGFSPERDYSSPLKTHKNIIEKFKKFSLLEKIAFHSLIALGSFYSLKFCFTLPRTIDIIAGFTLLSYVCLILNQIMHRMVVPLIQILYDPVADLISEKGWIDFLAELADKFLGLFMSKTETLEETISWLHRVINGLTLVSLMSGHCLNYKMFISPHIQRVNNKFMLAVMIMGVCLSVGNGCLFAISFPFNKAKSVPGAIVDDVGKKIEYVVNKLSNPTRLKDNLSKWNPIKYFRQKSQKIVPKLKIFLKKIKKTIRDIINLITSHKNLFLFIFVATVLLPVIVNAGGGVSSPPFFLTIFIVRVVRHPLCRGIAVAVVGLILYRAISMDSFNFLPDPEVEKDFLEKSNVELAKIEKMWEMPAVGFNNGEDIGEGDPGYFASQNSGMTSGGVLRNSGMTKEREKGNDKEGRDDKEKLFFVKKLFALVSVVVLILRIMIAPMTSLNPPPVESIRAPVNRRPPLRYRMSRAVKPVTDFIVKGLSAHGPTDVIEIEPRGNFSIKHKVEITAYNALYDVPVKALVTDYYLVFIFKEGLLPGTQPQIFLKNRGWKDLYAYPRPTNKQGIVIFRPGIDPCNVCKFKPEETTYGDISAIGVKAWHGSPDNVLENLKGVYVIRKDIELADALGEKKAVSAKKELLQQVEIPPAPFSKGGEEAAIPQEKPKKQTSSDPDAIEVPLDIPNTWYGQKWLDSQAITNVRYDPKRKVLVGDFNIIQGHPNFDRGEVIVDVLKLGIAPFNFDKYELTADVKVVVKEGSFGYTPNNADGVGFFVKTGPAQGWKNAYEWENHPENEVGKWKTISFDRGEFNKIDRVDPQDGFPLKDPIIRMFGIKLGAGKDRTGSKFTKAKGEILVRNVRILPRREKYAPPDFWPKAPEARKEVPGEIKIPITTNWPVREDAGNWAVKATHAKNGMLALTVKLRGGDPEGDHNKGETYLPLYDKRGKRVVPVQGLPETGYFSGKGKVVKSLVWAPKSYAEGKKIPSAIQAGAHDKDYNYQNNAWNPSLITKNLTGQWHELKFYPMDPAENEPGYTDDDFLVTAINELLYKTGLPGSASPDYEWDGHIYITDIRIEPDDRVFPEPVPPLIKTKMYAENPKDKPPVPIELFETLSGGGGYGLFDFDLTPEGLRALEEKVKNMPPDAHVWRHMALFGSLSPNGPILFDENDNFIDFGFIDPVTKKTVIIGVEGMKKCIDARLSILKRYGKVEITSLIAHDAADGKKKKENRIEGDRPNLFTDSKKFRKFLQGIKPILEHVRDKWRAPVPDLANLDLIEHNFNNPKTVVAMLELFNEPLNMDTAQVPVSFIQRRIHEFFELVYEIDPTWLLSTGMRDFESWKYFAHLTLPEYHDGANVVKNLFYKNVVPESHWYGDKEDVTPLETNVGKFFMPSHVLFWLKGELDPRTPEEYKAAIGIVEVMRKVYYSAYGGGLFWVDDEFLPNWADYRKFFKDNSAQVPFTPPTPAKPVQIAITSEVLKTLPDTIKAIKEGSFIYKDVTIFAQSEYPITFKMLTEKDVNIKLTRIGLKTEIIEALTGLAKSVILRGYPLNYETISRALKEIITLQAVKELIPHARTLRDRGIPVTRKTLSRALKKQKKIALSDGGDPGYFASQNSRMTSGGASKFAEKASYTVIPEFARSEYPGSLKHKKLIMSIAAMLIMAPAIAGAQDFGKTTLWLSPDGTLILMGIVIIFLELVVMWKQLQGILHDKLREERQVAKSDAQKVSGKLKQKLLKFKWFFKNKKVFAEKEKVIKKIENLTDSRIAIKVWESASLEHLKDSLRILEQLPREQVIHVKEIKFIHWYKNILPQLKSVLFWIGIGGYASPLKGQLTAVIMPHRAAFQWCFAHELGHVVREES